MGNQLPTCAQTLGSKVSLTSLSFPLHLSPESLHGGICINMLERLLSWGFATSEAAADLSPTTSGLWQRSLQRRGARCRQGVRSICHGGRVLKCTQNLG